MNILVVTQMFSQPDDAGDNKPTRTVNYFVKEWAAMGNSVIVMHCPSKFPIAFYLIPQCIKSRFAGRISTMVPPISSRKELQREEKGVKIFRLPMLKMKPGQAYSPTVMDRQVKKISRILNDERFIPDLIVGHFANPSTELTSKLAELYQAKSSIVFHQDCDETNIHRYRIKENIDKIGAIGARSVTEAYEIQRLLGLNKKPFVCCSGAPNDAVRAAKKICDKHDFREGARHLYVGSLIKRKHLDVVIRAFLNTAGDNDSLTVVGGGPEEENLKKLVHDLKAEKRILFTGRVSREQVLTKMSEAQIFTLISEGEAYGMVYIESMLQGCLTIASRGEGFDGIIRDAENGFICAAGDQRELESIYKKIYKMSMENRNCIGQAAIDTAVHYSEKEVAERYLRDILENQR